MAVWQEGELPGYFAQNVRDSFPACMLQDVCRHCLLHYSFQFASVGESIVDDPHGWHLSGLLLFHRGKQHPSVFDLPASLQCTQPIILVFTSYPASVHL